MDFTTLLLALFAAGGAWFWFDSLRAREAATAIAKEFCERKEVQFLDGTASLTGLSLKTSDHGFSIVRCYQFDFAESGSLRRKGLIIMLGSRMQHFLVDDNIFEC